MHIGIIRYKNKIIYIDIKDNKIYGYYYNKKGKQNVSSNTISSLINCLFEREKETFVTTENEYKIYINKETGYKHFYKNNQQNILKFFLENGKNAIMYAKENENVSVGKKVKEFYNKHKRIRFILNFTVIFSILMSTDVIDKALTIAEHQGIEISIIEEKYDCFFDYNQLCELIQSSHSLSNEEKESLFNEDLFSDICKTPMSIDRIKDLEEKTTNIEIVPITEQDYQNLKKINEENVVYIDGYYNILEPNIIHIYQNLDPEKIEDVKFHEFIHLLQDNTKYHYIKEACAEIISNEYYGAPLSSCYDEETKRIKALMEVIGSNCIWKINFSGDDSQLLNLLQKNLSQEEYNSFCEILETSPSNISSEKQEMNKKFDEILSILYNNIYNSSIEEDEVIKKVYESETSEFFNIDRTYFNNSNLEDSKIVNKIQPLNEAIKDNTIDIDFYKENRRKVTKEEYQEKQRQGEPVDTQVYTYDNPEVNEYVLQELSKCKSPEEIQALEEKILKLGYGYLKYYSIELSPINVEEVSSLRQQEESITYNINYMSPEYSSANIIYSRDNEKGIEIPVVYFQKEIKLDNFKSDNRNLTETKKQVK